MPRILVTPYLLNGVRGRYCEILERAGFEVAWPTVDETSLRGAELIRHLEGVSGVLAGSEPYTREVLAASKLAGLRGPASAMTPSTYPRQPSWESP